MSCERAAKYEESVKGEETRKPSHSHHHPAPSEGTRPPSDREDRRGQLMPRRIDARCDWRLQHIRQLSLLAISRLLNMKINEVRLAFRRFVKKAGAYVTRPADIAQNPVSTGLAVLRHALPLLMVRS